MKPTDYPKILLVGRSGSGKTSSLRNLMLPQVALINGDDKALPFPKANLGHYEEVMKASAISIRLQQIDKMDNISVVILDSITILGESVESELALIHNNGFDLYADYKKIMFKIIRSIKKMNKIVIVTAISEVIEATAMKGGVMTTSQNLCAALQGQKMRGRLEANFTMVMFSQMKDKEYVMETNNGNSNTAKTPLGMYEGKRFIPNDLLPVLERVYEFYTIGNTLALPPVEAK